jgi:AraC-like DNA-binding protein
MQNDVQRHSVCAGLEIKVAGRGLDMAFPRAVIHLQSIPEGLETDGGSDAAILVHLSPSRLRMLLGNAPISESLLSGDATEFAIDNPTLVRHIALEILRSDYRDDCLRIFLKGKVVELLVALLAQPEDGRERTAAMVARDILLRDPLNPPTMGELSRLVGASQRRLSTDFQRAFGLTVTEWLADWRLCRGRELIAESALPIAEVSASLGYAHLSTFTAAFAKKFGAPPTRFRSHKASE